MNIQNTALAVSSAITLVLADGDDHAGALPHVSTFFAFIKEVKAGNAKLSVRGILRQIVLVCSADSVALYEQTKHCSAMATFPFPQCSAHKDQKNELLVLLTHTHTAKSQEDMWAHTHKKYEEANGGTAPYPPCSPCPPCPPCPRTAYICTACTAPARHRRRAAHAAVLRRMCLPLCL